MKDYYNILGIQPNASEDEIRSAYKKLAMKHHPDRGGDQAAFQDVQEAYSTLTDPGKRQQWEQQQAFGQAHHGQGGFGFSFNFGPDLNEVFRSFHSGAAHFGHGFRQQARNRDLRTSIELDLVSTLEPQTRYVEINDNNSNRRTVEINIPRGVHTGMQMRFTGYGENHVPGVPPGDLYIDFQVKPAHGFTVQGLNLHKKVMINCIDAILGTTLNVNGLDGSNFQITIPAGTQPATQLRLAQQGLWNIHHPVRGDLFVEILVEIPLTVTKEQLDLLSKLT